MNKIIETSGLKDYCGGCNNTVLLHKFVQVDEAESLEDAIARRHENEGDVYSRTKFIGFCPCGNIWVLTK